MVSLQLISTETKSQANDTNIMKSFLDFYRETSISKYIKPETIRFDEFKGEIYSTDDLTLFRLSSNNFASKILYEPQEFSSNAIHYCKDDGSVLYEADEIGYIDWWDLYDILTGDPNNDEGYGLFESSALAKMHEFGEMLVEYFKEALDYRKDTQKTAENIKDGYAWMAEQSQT